MIDYPKMLQEEVHDLGVDTLSGDVRKIEANARHLHGLINDALDFSKIKAGPVDVFAATFDVANTIRDVAATVERLVALKGNALHLATADDVGTARVVEVDGSAEGRLSRDGTGLSWPRACSPVRRREAASRFMTFRSLTISAMALAGLAAGLGAGHGVCGHLPGGWALFSFAVATFRVPPP